MTATRVVTARITPRRVKKLRSLWARRASRDNLSVSNMVTAALRNLATVNGRLAVEGTAREKPVNRSIGATPNQTSVCFAQGNTGIGVKSFPYIYRRRIQPFAFSETGCTVRLTLF